MWLLITSTLIHASLTFLGDCSDLISPQLTHTHTHTEQRHQTQAYSIGMLTHATLSLPQVDILAAVCVERGGASHTLVGVNLLRIISLFCSVLLLIPLLLLSPPREMRVGMADFPGFHSSALSSSPLVHPTERLSSPAACKKKKRLTLSESNRHKPREELGVIVDNHVDPSDKIALVHPTEMCHALKCCWHE